MQAIQQRTDISSEPDESKLQFIDSAIATRHRLFGMD